MEKTLHFIGADLAKKSIDLVIHGLKSHLKIENNSTGFNQVLVWLKANRIPLTQAIVVMEHTGLYSYCFENFLFEKSIQFSKVSSLDIKLSIGVTRGKSDRIDATRIARYGSENVLRLTLATPMLKALERLKILSSSRDNLVRVRAGLMNSTEELRNIGTENANLALGAQLKVITCLNEQILALDQEMECIIKSEEKININYQLIKTIKGIGPVVARNTIIKTHNFERFTNARKFACFCGIAPFEHTSGTSIKGRTRVNHLADKEMKCLLDLAAKSAITCDPELKEYYQRRLEMGKPKMATINIVRNKLVGRIFAVVKRQSAFMVCQKVAA